MGIVIWDEIGVGFVEVKGGWVFDGDVIGDVDVCCN